MQILQKCFDLRLACPFLSEAVRSVSMLTYPLTIFNFFVRVNSGLSNVCKINFRLSGVTLLSRNLVLQDCWETGSKSCKLEVTFAIHPDHSYSLSFFPFVTHHCTTYRVIRIELRSLIEFIDISWYNKC